MKSNRRKGIRRAAYAHGILVGSRAVDVRPNKQTALAHRKGKMNKTLGEEILSRKKTDDLRTNLGDSCTTTTRPIEL